MRRLKAGLLILIFTLSIALGACSSKTSSSAVTTAAQTTAAAVSSAASTTAASKASAASTTAASKSTKASSTTAASTTAATLDKDGSYTTKEDVALYIHTYGKLPSNFITKSAAEKLGWPGGSLEPYAPGKCIGGSTFGNYEGLLPKASGRTYKECDIDTLGASSRGTKRIVYSNDGLIYYTEDHYTTFELLYGNP